MVREPPALGFGVRLVSFAGALDAALRRVSCRRQSAVEGAQRFLVDDGDAAPAGGHEMLVSQGGESACD